MNGRSVWAILAGVLLIVIGSTAIDAVLHATNVYPPAVQPLSDALSALALSYRVVFGIAGGWLTAKLAPDRPMTHALRLGMVGTVLGVIGVVATWNRAMGPHWYPIVLAVLAIPQCWAGGWLHTRGRA